MKFNKWTLGLCALCALAFTSGCATPTARDAVPATEISGNLNGAPVSAKLPKDVKLDLLKFAAETNGSVTLEIRGLDARMNPDIITMTGQAYSQMRAADTAHDTAVLKTGAEAAGGLLGEGAKTMAK